MFQVQVFFFVFFFELGGLEREPFSFLSENASKFQYLTIYLLFNVCRITEKRGPYFRGVSWGALGPRPPGLIKGAQKQNKKKERERRERKEKKRKKGKERRGQKGEKIEVNLYNERGTIQRRI